MARSSDAAYSYWYGRLRLRALDSILNPLLNILCLHSVSHPLLWSQSFPSHLELSMKRYTLFALAGLAAARPQLPLNTPPKAGDPICLGTSFPRFNWSLTCFSNKTNRSRRPSTRPRRRSPSTRRINPGLSPRSPPLEKNKNEIRTLRRALHEHKIRNGGSGRALELRRR